MYSVCTGAEGHRISVSKVTNTLWHTFCAFGTHRALRGDTTREKGYTVLSSNQNAILYFACAHKTFLYHEFFLGKCKVATQEMAIQLGLGTLDRAGIN